MWLEARGKGKSTGECGEHKSDGESGSWWLG